MYVTLDILLQIVQFQFVMVYWQQIVQFVLDEHNVSETILVIVTLVFMEVHNVKLTNAMVFFQQMQQFAITKMVPALLWILVPVPIPLDILDHNVLHQFVMEHLQVPHRCVLQEDHVCHQIIVNVPILALMVDHNVN